MGLLRVSLHDVTPVLEKRSRRLVDIAMEYAGTSFTVLLVPDFHSRGRLDRFPQFCTWLRELRDMGVEFALHGCTHLGGGRFLTSGEGEFLGMSAKEAAKRVSEGKAIFQDAMGEEPSGFTAPAWIYSAGTMEALGGYPFQWVETRSSLRFSTGKRERSPVVVFASRTPWKRFCSGSWAVLAPVALMPFPVVRAALHTRDLPGLERPVKRLLARTTRHRETAPCGELTQTSREG
ncbi:MAG TPA: polysaccharide deacetylase family protein [Candidatus Sabulitectum sp.]|nr:polysaccharide deacetylase family protein [Candidatus Sabulitectum sp.]HPF33006.1 polysaccharide deacetylase family protein [Candidatus Sabulitectum sp.]HPJ27611.1 polysaccharide deacetylase family protein [Candidatus Sabulitectum sp.]HPR21413.1 polysaccharide deacetylase family protein [Candidatus Sabulitectum sp.]HRW77229.1 polysaccharide deacetylase family protein [Candidatus Sabulitectum sp.]